MFADRSGVVRLTPNSLIDANPTWSPDGTKLVFERCCENSTSDLFTSTWRRGREVNVTPHGAPGVRSDLVAGRHADRRVRGVRGGRGIIDIWSERDGPVAVAGHAGGSDRTSPNWQPNPA
jgi:Tol biopolymer transport system component